MANGVFKHDNVMDKNRSALVQCGSYCTCSNA